MTVRWDLRHGVEQTLVRLSAEQGKGLRCRRPRHPRPPSQCSKSLQEPRPRACCPTSLGPPASQGAPASCPSCSPPRLSPLLPLRCAKGPPSNSQQHIQATSVLVHSVFTGWLLYACPQGVITSQAPAAHAPTTGPEQQPAAQAQLPPITSLLDQGNALLPSWLPKWGGRRLLREHMQL